MALLPEQVNIPELVRTERTAPDFGTSAQTRLETPQIQEPELISQIAEVAEEQIRGEIPEDVQQEVQQITAEQGISTGVAGQAADFLTAQSLGLTSLDIQGQGIQTGLAVSQLQLQREQASADLNLRTGMFNEEMNRSFAALEEEQRQWDDRILMMEQEHELNELQLDLAAAELISRNQQFLQGLVAEVAIANSKTVIQGAQDLIDSWVDYFGLTNAQIADLFDFDVKLGL